MLLRIKYGLMVCSISPMEVRFFQMIKLLLLESTSTMLKRLRKLVMRSPLLRKTKRKEKKKAKKEAKMKAKKKPTRLMPRKQMRKC